MPQFRYRGQKRQESVSGILEAADLDQAAAELTRQGIIPIEIHPEGEGLALDAPVDLKALLGLNQVNRDDLILFCRQMYALTKAGIPLMKAPAMKKN